MSIKKNLIYNVTYQMLILILPLITTPYISRVIGVDGVGVQSYTYSIVNYFVLFAMLGINNHGNRSVAMVRDNKENLSRVFLSIYSVQVIISLIMIIFYSIYVYFIVDKYKIIFLIQLIYIISALFDINWFFFGIEEFKLTVIRNTIIKLLSVLSIFIFVKDKNDLYIYSLILALGVLIGQLILWKFIGRYIKLIKIDINNILEQIKPILILFIPIVAISIYKIMDKIMIGSMNTITQVGFYENSEKIINIPIGIIVALGTVMLPKISNLEAKGKKNQSKKYISISMDFVMFMAFGSMFGLIGVSPVLIPIFLGKEFIQCIDIVSILSVTILFIAWANVIRMQFLIPKKKDKIYIVSTILGAIVNLVINLLLIRKYGAIGATIGTVLAEATVAIYQTIKVKEELDINTYIKRNMFFVIPGIFMCLIIRYIGLVLNKTILTGIIQIIVGGSIYCLIGIIYMIRNKNEVVNQILKRYNFMKK
ncbi:flippase [Clostridium chauvoei]|uniref:Flippase n=4 Tax=Clostridium chauvoei TaxID=46867 RepID=A0ABD4RFF8_9CLOT|nr:flippase [Clostridium chauvoei]ATD54286.1 flippase [Clostridium chauvoei]ATD58031.1 flippase [Clostridium chauvoei]MBX7279892.1 flippase [Clostridium chauvoei]MBX7282190.1 flippase [Clostridium chauvoei]MBX7284782.1 flippase [Clostridium chauvoei]